MYANILYEPGDGFYSDQRWREIADWKDELAPWYDQAKRMLGAATYPRMTPSDKVMLHIATDLGIVESFHVTPVGVCFTDSDGEGAAAGAKARLPPSVSHAESRPGVS